MKLERIDLQELVLHFNVVKCIKSGDGFTAGQYYAQVGSRAGLGICREDEYGNVVNRVCHCYVDVFDHDETVLRYPDCEYDDGCELPEFVEVKYTLYQKKATP